MAASRRIVPRSEWGARYGNGNDVSSRLPWRLVVIHTEAGALRPSDWTDLEGAKEILEAWRAEVGEIGKVRSVERFHAETRGWDGIVYSFFITFDGTIFEGRGWGRSGAHTEGVNSSAAGICLEGHGDIQNPTPAQWASIRWLIGDGIRTGDLAVGYAVDGHRKHSLKGKTCPGLLVTDAELASLEGITGPINEETEEVLNMAEITEKRLREIIREEVKAEADGLREGVLVSIDEGRKHYASLRGWIVAVGLVVIGAEKPKTYEALRNLAHKNDPVSTPTP